MIHSILSEAIREWEANILFVDINNYISKAAKKPVSIEMTIVSPTLPIVLENDDKESKQQGQPGDGLNTQGARDGNPMYKKFIDQPWKRAVFIGLIVAVVAVLVFSLWIGITGLTLAAIFSGSFFAGSMCYFLRNCFCSGTKELDPPPLCEPVNTKEEVRIRAGSFQDALRAMEKKKDGSDQTLIKEKRGAFFERGLNREPLSNALTIPPYPSYNPSMSKK